MRAPCLCPSVIALAHIRLPPYLLDNKGLLRCRGLIAFFLPVLMRQKTGALPLSKPNRVPALASLTPSHRTLFALLYHGRSLPIPLIFVRWVQNLVRRKVRVSLEQTPHGEVIPRRAWRSLLRTQDTVAFGSVVV